MGKHTPLYNEHVRANAKMVDFAGWDMPLHYGSQIQEHHSVRQHAGLFDVSHMGIIDFNGKEAAACLRFLLANDINKLSEGKALYTCMLNAQGGIIDDLIVYQQGPQAFRMVVNAATCQKDLDWVQKHAGGHEVNIVLETGLAMIAVQGPAALGVLKQCISPSLCEAIKPFHFAMIDDCFVARTGYTGENGYEMIVPSQKAVSMWQCLIAAGARPCGLAARDTLRLEAGLNLYGLDMDESVTPFEANLDWTVTMGEDRKFIGRDALEKYMNKRPGLRCLVGLVLKGQGIIRPHQKVWTDTGEGTVTSGGYSPTLEKSIAFARVPQPIGKTCFVEIRQKRVLAQVIKPPFVRQGKKAFAEIGGP